MLPNIDRYKKDLESLISRGEMLENAIQREFFRAKFDALVKEQLGDQAEEYIKSIPTFTKVYQSWYSEAKVLIKQLLPDRLADFVSLYEIPKTRKVISFESYRIADCLRGLTATSGYEKMKVVGPEGAISLFRQQVAILLSVRTRFESSLYDIRQLVQADLFDSELDAAEELINSKFTRAAGALSGVVLERHLYQVCQNHSIKISKKDPSISDLNDSLKNANVIDIPQWRSIQYLADIRNLCDHNRKVEPTTEQVNELIAGVKKVTKTLF